MAPQGQVVYTAKKGCTHQLALPWGTRHLISPESAGQLQW